MTDPNRRPEEKTYLEAEQRLQDAGIDTVDYDTEKEGDEKYKADLFDYAKKKIVVEKR